MTIVSRTMVSHFLSTQFVVQKNGNNEPTIYLHVLTILMNFKCLQQVMTKIGVPALHQALWVLEHAIVTVPPHNAMRMIWCVGTKKPFYCKEIINKPLMSSRNHNITCFISRIITMDKISPLPHCRTCFTLLKVEGST